MITDLFLAQLCQKAYDPKASWDNVWTSKSVYVYHRRVFDTNFIVFRGSDNLTDWLRDLKGWPAYHKDLGFCHAGFLEDMETVVGEVLALCNGEPIVITGHSLGAARALILGGLLTVLKVPPKAIVVFGEPRPGFSKLKLILVRGGFPIRSYKNREDPVEQVPYWLGLYKHPTDPIPVNYPMPQEYVGLPDHGIDLYVGGLRKMTNEQRSEVRRVASA